MTIEANGAYRDGAIHPDKPLPLPDNTPVRVLVIPQPAPDAQIRTPSPPDNGRLIPPPSPRITVEEFDAIFRKHAFSAPPLPADFSRADIYSDRD
jgi:hypothetical protein